MRFSHDFVGLLLHGTRNCCNEGSSPGENNSVSERKLLVLVGADEGKLLAHHVRSGFDELGVEYGIMTNIRNKCPPRIDSTLVRLRPGAKLTTTASTSGSNFDWILIYISWWDGGEERSRQPLPPLPGPTSCLWLNIDLHTLVRWRWGLKPTTTASTSRSNCMSLTEYWLTYFCEIEARIEADNHCLHFRVQLHVFTNRFLTTIILQGWVSSVVCPQI